VWSKIRSEIGPKYRWRGECQGRRFLASTKDEHQSCTYRTGGFVRRYGEACNRGCQVSAKCKGADWRPGPLPASEIIFKRSWIRLQGGPTLAVPQSTLCRDRAFGFGVNTKDILPAPRIGIRVVLHGMQPPFFAIGHGIGRNGAKKPDLLAALGFHALVQRRAVSAQGRPNPLPWPALANSWSSSMTRRPGHLLML